MKALSPAGCLGNSFIVMTFRFEVVYLIVLMLKVASFCLCKLANSLTEYRAIVGIDFAF